MGKKDYNIFKIITLQLRPSNPLNFGYLKLNHVIDDSNLSFFKANNLKLSD